MPTLAVFSRLLRLPTTPSYRVATPRSASSPIAVSSEGVPSVCLTTASANQKASWEHVDDWELSGGIVEHKVALVGSSDASGQGEPIAGVLFGGVPSLEEAKEVTAALKDALDLVYLSPPQYGDTARDSDVSSVSNPEETIKACASAPKPAIQAFKLLSESADVQAVKLLSEMVRKSIKPAIQAVKLLSESPDVQVNCLLL